MKRRIRTAAIAAAGVLAVVLMGAATEARTGSTVSVPMHPSSWPAPVASWVPSAAMESLPIPPGSTRSLVPFASAIDPMPGALHVLVGQATYVVPVASTEVARWYARAFGRLGWRAVGSGSYGNAHSGTLSQMEAFSPSRRNSRMTANISWAPHGQGHSVVQYWVTHVLLPPKPTSARLPQDMVKVVAHPIYSPGHGAMARTVTNAAWIARLVQRINGLPTAPGGVSHGCPPFGGVGLVLYPATGAAIHVTAYCDTITVRGTGLTDTNFAVEKMAEALFPRSTFGP